MDIANYAREQFIKKGVDIRDSEAPIIPLNTYDDDMTFIACKKIFEAGVYVNPVVSPAAPTGGAIIRTSYMATLTKEQIDRATDIIAKVMGELGLLKK